MSINVWNLSQSKTTFYIRERTQAQRKHLNKLKHVKSALDLRNSAYIKTQFRQIGSISRIIEGQCHQLSPDKIQLPSSFNENSNLTTIVHKPKLLNPNTSFVDNLRVSSSLSRVRFNREIQKQNQKLFSRLIRAKPSISEVQFKKNHLNHLKYKQNILKNKYVNPDYTNEVKLQSKSLAHLLLKPIQNLNNKLANSKNSSRVKTLASDVPSDSQFRFQYFENKHRGRNIYP